MVPRLRFDAAASSVCDHPTNARAARDWTGVSMLRGVGPHVIHVNDNQNLSTDVGMDVGLPGLLPAFLSIISH
jgi:hypothetical protein